MEFKECRWYFVARYREIQRESVGERSVEHGEKGKSAISKQKRKPSCVDRKVRNAEKLNPIQLVSRSE
jgi:hypothetical protein